MTGIQPELWVDRAGATVLHRVAAAALMPSLDVAGVGATARRMGNHCRAACPVCRAI